jgi:hypothetical protein
LCCSAFSFTLWKIILPVQDLAILFSGCIAEFQSIEVSFCEILFRG